MIRYRSLVAVLLAQLPVLGGCSDALIYGERTSFNLAVSVNDDPTLPLSANAGLHRRIVNFAPALGGRVQDSEGKLTPNGEAVSVVSDFDLQYDENTTFPVLGKLTVATRFAAGMAAITVAGDPVAVAAIMRGTYAKSTPTKDKLISYLGTPRDPAHLAKMRACAAKIPALKGVPDASIIHKAELEPERAGIIKCLDI